MTSCGVDIELILEDSAEQFSVIAFSAKDLKVKDLRRGRIDEDLILNGLDAKISKQRT
jgi:hypothetical protein